MSVTFDTLRFVERLEAAGFPHSQAKATAEAFAEATSQELVTRDYLDSRLASLEGKFDSRFAGLETKMVEKIAEAKTDTIKWIVSLIGFQTLVILGGLVALIRLLH